MPLYAVNIYSSSKANYFNIEHSLFSTESDARESFESLIVQYGKNSQKPRFVDGDRVYIRNGNEFYWVELIDIRENFVETPVETSQDEFDNDEEKVAEWLSKTPDFMEKYSIQNDFRWILK